MSYISVHFAAMTAALFFLYYVMPKRFQPYLLLLGSLYFYFRCSGLLLAVMLAASVLAYAYGRIAPSKRTFFQSKYLCALCVILLLAPLLFFKYNTMSIGIPIGISFYTLQLIAYCVDVYKGKCTPEKNLLHFILFTSFFPQILQGPIPRYEELKTTLLVPHEYKKEYVASGFSKILAGLFLKFLIANKAAVLVDYVFNSNELELMSGCAFLLAGILYSFQLYADFLSCVFLAQGISLLFGVHLSENFSQPYCAASIKDFWRRWHMSLSSWLRDYVYIPLGGNRKGVFRTNINLLLTFLVSGIWHGAGFKFAFWGLLHGLYQIIGKYTLSLRDKFFTAVKCPHRIRMVISRISTFLLVMTAWIIFRANSLADGLYALWAILFRFSCGTLVTNTSADSLLILGLSVPELILLILCIALVLYFDYRTDNGHPQTGLLVEKSAFRQCVCALIMLLIIAVFGTYGFGYDAGTFIYGGF